MKPLVAPATLLVVAVVVGVTICALATTCQAHSRQLISSPSSGRNFVSASQIESPLQQARFINYGHQSNRRHGGALETAGRALSGAVKGRHSSAKRSASGDTDSTKKSPQKTGKGGKQSARLAVKARQLAKARAAAKVKMAARMAKLRTRRRAQAARMLQLSSGSGSSSNNKQKKTGDEDKAPGGHQGKISLRIRRHTTSARSMRSGGRSRGRGLDVDVKVPDLSLQLQKDKEELDKSPECPCNYNKTTTTTTTTTKAPYPNIEQIQAAMGSAGASLAQLGQSFGLGGPAGSESGVSSRSKQPELPSFDTQLLFGGGLGEQKPTQNSASVSANPQQTSGSDPKNFDLSAQVQLGEGGNPIGASLTPSLFGSTPNKDSPQSGKASGGTGIGDHTGGGLSSDEPRELDLDDKEDLIGDELDKVGKLEEKVSDRIGETVNHLEDKLEKLDKKLESKLSVSKPPTGKGKGDAKTYAKSVYPVKSDLYESPKMAALPTGCRYSVREIQNVIVEVVYLLERISRKFLLDESLDLETRDFISHQLSKIRTTAEESRMAANLAHIRSLNEAVRSTGLKLARLAASPGARRLEPSLQAVALKVRKAYANFKKECSGAY